MPSRRLLVVTPWYSRDLTGGAERLAWQVATALRGRGHDVHVFATCGEGFTKSWSRNHYPPGVTTEDGVAVQRFPLDSRNAEAFDRANAALLAQPRGTWVPEASPVDDAAAATFIEHTIRSRPLEDAIESFAPSFDGVLFVPYLYGPTLHGFPRAGGRGVIQPCLHDEPYAYLPYIANLIHSARSLVFNSFGERDLAMQLYGPSVAGKSTIVGHWVDPPVLTPIRRVGRLALAETRYVLYLGRRDRTKNLALLVQSFLDYRRYRDDRALRLVLIGPGVTSFDDPRNGIDDLGFVSEEQKAALLHYALAVAQPSTNESFSRTMMEAWSIGKPVLAHTRCASTADAVRTSGGGILAGTRAEWSSAFAEFEKATPERLAEFAECGTRYYGEHGSAAHIVERYERALLHRDFPRNGEQSLAARTRTFHDDERRRLTLAWRHRDAERAGVAEHLPLADSEYWDVSVDGALMRRLAAHSNLIVYASEEIGALDCCEELLAVFAFLLSFGVDARLAILGSFREAGLEQDFRALLARHELTSRVEIVKAPSRAVASAYLRSARLYLSLADAVTTRVAFADAMLHRVPIVAFSGAGVADLLGEAGVLAARKDEHLRVAALVKIALEDIVLRETLISAGLHRLRAFQLQELQEIQPEEHEARSARRPALR